MNNMFANYTAHHAAHYVIAAVLALGGSAAFYHQAQKPPVLINASHVGRVTADLWAPLSEAQSASLQAAFTSLALPKLTVYCIDPKCDDIADDFAEAARSAGTDVTFERSVIGPAGFSVGATDERAASVIADAIAAATGLTPRIPSESYATPYVAFGKK